MENLKKIQEWANANGVDHNDLSFATVNVGEENLPYLNGVLDQACEGPYTCIRNGENTLVAFKSATDLRRFCEVNELLLTASTLHKPPTNVDSQMRFIDAFRKYVCRVGLHDSHLIIEAIPYVFPAELDIEIRCDVDCAKLTEAMLLNVANLINIIQLVDTDTLKMDCYGRLDGEFVGVYKALVSIRGNAIKAKIEENDTVNPSFDPLWDIKYVVAVLSYIQQPTIYADLIEVDEFTQKSRKKHGKRPLPPYRIIRPGQTIVRHRPANDRSHEGTGTGTPKCGHWRRGTTYVRKDGRVIHRRGYAVKGGSRPVLVLPPNPVEWN